MTSGSQEAASCSLSAHLPPHLRVTVQERGPHAARPLMPILVETEAAAHKLIRLVLGVFTFITYLGQCSPTLDAEIALRN